MRVVIVVKNGQPFTESGEPLGLDQSHVCPDGTEFTLSRPNDVLTIAHQQRRFFLQDNAGYALNDKGIDRLAFVVPAEHAAALGQAVEDLAARQGLSLEHQLWPFKERDLEYHITVSLTQGPNYLTDGYWTVVFHKIKGRRYRPAEATYVIRTKKSPDGRIGKMVVHLSPRYNIEQIVAVIAKLGPA